MRAGITVSLSPRDRKRLLAIIDDCNSPQKHVWRAEAEQRFHAAMDDVPIAA